MGICRRSLPDQKPNSLSHSTNWLSVGKRQYYSMGVLTVSGSFTRIWGKNNGIHEDSRYLDAGSDEDFENGGISNIAGRYFLAKYTWICKMIMLPIKGIKEFSHCCKEVWVLQAGKDLMQWQAEVNLFGRLSHPNLVKAVGDIVMRREMCTSFGVVLVEMLKGLRAIDRRRPNEQHFQRMQSFLRDADRRQDEEESVKNWVSEIRETAYDVEDIIEEFALKVALRRRSGMVNVMKRRQQQQLRRSYSHIVEEEIVGLEEDVKVLAEQLVNHKILLTTRKMDVALHPDPTCFLHVPPQLNDDESWELFKKKACLPLAIIVLGGLLATKKTIFEWDVVRQNIISHLRRGKGDEQLLGVTEVLALSYHELPYQLKPCFLHLAHFPEDCEIQTKKMIRMWVAEGFVSSVYNGVEEETMEDVAQRYLGELVERCMVQVVERGITGRIRTCRMHDLMRDLCVSKAKQENFLEVFNQSLASDHSADSFPRSTVREARSIGRLRRLAVVLEGDLHKFIPSGYKRNSHLRSLLYFHEKACHAENWGSIKSVFKNFKLLRVLDLEGNLRYLQTLDLLTWNSTVQIPNVVWRLESIATPTLVNFPAEKCEITDLVRLNHLKKLVIDDPKFGAIFRSPHVRFYRLQSLSFVSNEDSTVVQVIQGCPNLYKLHIEWQIEKLPECQHFSANLAKLNLLGSKLTEDPMPTLEKLPTLRILRLQMDSFLGNKMVCLDKEISNCTSLKTVPEGLRFITSLREMEIRSMLKAFRTRLEHGGEDYYKVQHVPSIAFRYCDY
ncbi:disease resistance protein [Populus alba x Populus x berolinensis]|uniref:Disease resistance protein n=1 Tax=Populus alba x Populus x berolinensis TaxID=444605 RepID=A0AAD6PRS5_9ROSI|nr:disease resistance protein [Populus alba x Populus x berolinensis]